MRAGFGTERGHIRGNERACQENLIDTSLITATCGTVEDNLAFAKVKDYEVIRPIDKPYSQTRFGGVSATPRPRLGG